MNEENGLRGGNAYATQANLKGENHVFALESDSGGFTPRGFSFDCDAANFSQIQSWQPLFKPYLIHYFEKGWQWRRYWAAKKTGYCVGWFASR